MVYGIHDNTNRDRGVLENSISLDAAAALPHHRLGFGAIWTCRGDTGTIRPFVNAVLGSEFSSGVGILTYVTPLFDTTREHQSEEEVGEKKILRRRSSESRFFESWIGNLRHRGSS